MISTIADWIKLVAVAAPLVIGGVAGAIKFFERYSAVPVLQKDVKSLKRDMRYVVRALEKTTKLPYDRRHDEEEGD